MVSKEQEEGREDGEKMANRCRGVVEKEESAQWDNKGGLITINCVFQKSY